MIFYNNYHLSSPYQILRIVFGTLQTLFLILFNIVILRVKDEVTHLILHPHPFNMASLPRELAENHTRETWVS